MNRQATLDIFSQKCYNVLMTDNGPNRVQNIAEYKIDPLLHAFYVLQHPEEARPYRPQFDQFGRLESRGPWEKVLVDPGLPLEQREEYIKDKFLPFVEALRLGASEDPYEELVRFCNTFVQMEFVSEYANPQDFDARNFLPPKEVIDAMAKQWSESPRSSCPPLIDYLATFRV